MQTAAHLHPEDEAALENQATTAKELETKYLIEVMKHNYEAINVTDKYK